MPFTVTPSFRTDVVALPRQDTHTLSLDNFLNPNAYLNGYSIEGGGGRADLAQLLSEQFDYKSFLDWTELTGRVESINSLEVFNYESGLMERNVGIATIKAGSTAGQVTFTLTPDSHTNTGSINGAQDRSPLKVNDLIQTKNLLTGIIISKTGSGTTTEYTAIRRDGVSDNLLTALQSHIDTSTRLISYSTAFAEGSKGPDEGMFQSTLRLMNQMQTFRSKDTITGDVDALRRVIPWMGKNYQLDVTRLRQEMAHRLDVNRAMFLSPGGNITIPGSGPGTGRVRLTTGLLPGVATLGATFSHSATAGYTAADIDEFDAMVQANYAGSSFTVFQGYRHAAAFQKGLQATMGVQPAVLDYSSFGKGNAQQKAIDMGFNHFRTPGGIWYHTQTNNIFNEPQMTATKGYPYPDMAIFIPDGQQTITQEQNGVPQKVQVPSLRLLHTTSSNGDKRRNWTWYRGIETTDIDEKSVNTLTQQAIQVVNMRNYTLGIAA